MTRDVGEVPAGGAGVYGVPPGELVDVPRDAVQLSPLVPSSREFEDIAAATLAGITVYAPPGTIERRAVLAHAVRVTRPGGRIVALAPKDKGGARLARELSEFGAAVTDEARRHHRIVTASRPDEPVGLDAAISEGAPRLVERLALWSQPGVFSWDRIDPGSALLMRYLPPLSGRGADLGCGIGVLAQAALAGSPEIFSLVLADVDRRAVGCARKNVTDPRARFAWADVRDLAIVGPALDFVLMNPPFHDGGAEDKALGRSFIRRAGEILRRGGTCLMVANRHLPYETVLGEVFGAVRVVAAAEGFKVLEAVR